MPTDLYISAGQRFAEKVGGEDQGYILKVKCLMIGL